MTLPLGQVLGEHLSEVAETTCDDCRMAITTDGIEIDASQGDLWTEGLALTFVVFMTAILYVGKKIVDKKFK